MAGLKPGNVGRNDALLKREYGQSKKKKVERLRGKSGE